MTRKSHLLALALSAAAALAPAAHAQDGAEYPDPQGLQQTNVNHRANWTRLAQNSAKEVVGSLGRFAKVTVAPPEGDSPFELALHEMLVSELNARDAFVVAGTPHARTVTVSVDLSPRLATRGEAHSLEQAAHRAGRALGLNMGPKMPPPQAADVTVTTTIKEGGVYLARRTEMFQVRGADLALYKQTAAELTVVGDEK